jgi:protein-S-isoprenylcysteine O-methyltransferase Ste14
VTIVGLVVVLVGLFVLYWIIRRAVASGIRDSRKHRDRD